MDREKSKLGIQSVEVASRLLAALLIGHRPKSLTEVANSCQMARSNVHRYMVSMIRSGLIERDVTGMKYQLGPLSIKLGLAAFEDRDVLRLALDQLPAIRDAIEETVALAVWDTQGPTFLKWELANRNLALTPRGRNALPLLSSATGQIFLTYLPESTTQPILLKELNHSSGKRRTAHKDVAEIRQRVSSRGYSAVEGLLLNAVSAVSVPIFDERGGIVGAITAMGYRGYLDTSGIGRVVTTLRRVTKNMQRKTRSHATTGATTVKRTKSQKN